MENSPRTPGSEAIRCPQGELKRGWGGCPSRRVRSEQGERLRASAGKMRILHPTATRRRPSPLTAHCARARGGRVLLGSRNVRNVDPNSWKLLITYQFGLSLQHFFLTLCELGAALPLAPGVAALIKHTCFYNCFVVTESDSTHQRAPLLGAVCARALLGKHFFLLWKPPGARAGTLEINTRC